MKRILISGLTVLMLGGVFSCKETATGKIKINADWKFKKLEETDISEEQYADPYFDDTSWEKVSLPHSANLEPMVVNDQWQGICWYRKVLVVPKSADDKKVFLELEAAMNHSKIWINGLLVTEHQGGYLPVVVDITKYIKKGDQNVLAVRLNNTDNPLTGPKPLKILDFNTYGGLYRNAWLIVKDQVYISHPVLADKMAGGGVFITTPKVSKEESVMEIKTHVINSSDQEQNIVVSHDIMFDGILVRNQESNAQSVGAGKDMETIMRVNLVDTKLWSPRAPNLYTVKTTILQNGKVIDTETTRTGIRSFTFDDQNQLYINGERTFLRGVNRHQEYPFVGYALSDNAQYRDAKKIKDAGFDYIRLSHYPQSPAFLDACDELGLVVLDAILGWQYYLDNDQFRAYCYRSAAELIRRDRNHPSVLAWEVSLNETQMPIFFMEELDRVVHAEYPGDNVYSAGWMNDVYNIYLQARQHRILHPKPLDEINQKPYSVSEYGDWEYYSNNAGLNQDKLPKNLRVELCSRQLRSDGEKRLLYQATNIQEAHNDNLSTTAFSDSYWVMYDYNRGYYDNLEASGIMDICRIPKFGYYFFQSQRDVSDGLVLNIASWWTKDSPLDVRVFSNCDEVALYLNDRLIAKQKPNQDSISMNLQHPPFTFKIPSFEAGTLRAVGIIKGEKVAEYVVMTPEQPSRLKLWLDESGRSAKAGQNDMLFLYIAAVDRNGTIIPNYDEIIEITLEGGADILNLGAIQSEAGIATALIRIADKPGNINVSARSRDGLEGNFEFSVK